MLLPERECGSSVVTLAESTVRGIVWPAVPQGAPAGRLLALQQQLNETQWLAPDALARRQFLQLGQLLAHTYQEVPYYRKPLEIAGYQPGVRVTPELWARIPRITRARVQDQGPGLRARRLPPSHGSVTSGLTSGSTARPVQVHASQVASLIWTAISLREHFWHDRVFSGTQAVIRPTDWPAPANPDGLRYDDWAPSTTLITPTGPSLLLDIGFPLAHQAEWLARHAPNYLITFPSNLLQLAYFCRDQAIALPSLREVRTRGEVLDREVRSACREAWGVPVTDVYSAIEGGSLALQCPEHGRYHVQSECVLVEVLDGDRPCGPGEVGRVVITPLHNFAMPFIRYELGDYAEVGEPCPCGRGLPVLTRILGNTRGFATLPSGERRWASLGGWTITKIAPIRQFQVVQTSLEHMDVRLVAARDVTPEEEAKVAELIRGRLGHPFALTFTYHDDIPRSSGGKYEEFRSELSDPLEII
jgi:phenylacetate-CoA ligase